MIEIEEKEAFDQTINKLYYLTCKYGINRVRPIIKNKYFFNLFLRQVHTGWEKAQNIIFEKIITNEQNISELKIELKDAKACKNKNNINKINENISKLKYRKLKLQMVINTIAWIIFKFDHHIVRRFFINNRIDNISKQALIKCKDFVNEINKNKINFAIYTDLTTFIHVGDVLYIDNDLHRINIVEIKEGKINSICREILDYHSHNNLCFKKIVENLPNEIGKQLYRMAKQDWRAEKVVEAIKNEEGIDISTNCKLKISEKRYYINTYEEIIIKLYKKNKWKKWAIDIIDDCLFIGLYSDYRMASTFDFWVQQYDKYSIIIDYRTVYSVNLARPPFSLQLPENILKDLVNEKIILKMSLWIPKWIEIINSKYNYKIELETKKETRRLLNKSKDILLYNGQALKIIKNEKIGYMGFGFISKIFYDFYKPLDYGKVFDDETYIQVE